MAAGLAAGHQAARTAIKARRAELYETDVLPDPDETDDVEFRHELGDPDEDDEGGGTP